MNVLRLSVHMKAVFLGTFYTNTSSPPKPGDLTSSCYRCLLIDHGLCKGEGWVGFSLCSQGSVWTKSKADTCTGDSGGQGLSGFTREHVCSWTDLESSPRARSWVTNVPIGENRKEEAQSFQKASPKTLNTPDHSSLQQCGLEGKVISRAIFFFQNCPRFIN